MTEISFHQSNDEEATFIEHLSFYRVIGVPSTYDTTWKIGDICIGAADGKAWNLRDKSWLTLPPCNPKFKLTLIKKVGIKELTP